MKNRLIPMDWSLIANYHHAKIGDILFVELKMNSTLKDVHPKNMYKFIGFWYNML